jgi:hypothetical protein
VDEFDAVRPAAGVAFLALVVVAAWLVEAVEELRVRPWRGRRRRHYPAAAPFAPPLRWPTDRQD